MSVSTPNRLTDGVRRPSVDAAATGDLPSRAPSDGVILSGVLCGLLAVYLPLLNGYWSPGGDSELFVVVARSIVRGEGYVYNGGPVTVTPPGWPLVLAGLMAVSPTFLWLKLCLIGMIVAAMGMTYAALRPFASPTVAGGAVLLSGVLGTVYPLTMWLHTEALFLLISSATIWAASRIGAAEDRPRQGRTSGSAPTSGWVAAAVVIGGALMVFTRWPALFQWPMLAALAIGPFASGVWRRVHDGSKQGLRRRSPRFWASVGSLVLMVATFFGTREGLRQYAEAYVEAEIAPGVSLTDEQVSDLVAEYVADLGIEAQTMALLVRDHGPDKGIVRQYVDRLLVAGHWASWLLWAPMRFGQAVGPVRVLSLLVGWVVIGLVSLAAWRGVTGRTPAGRVEWVWCGVILYCGALVMSWPSPNARYLVPVAPWLIVGVWRGLGVVGERIGSRSRSVAGAVFVASLLITNGALWAVDVAIARSGERYYATYWGGLHAGLISASQYVANRSPGRREVAVSERYQNLGRSSLEWFGPRAVVMLTDTAVRRVPRQHNREPNGAVNRWARERRVVWYLYQRPVRPWVVWHFRLPGWLQTRLGDVPAHSDASSGGWVLYRMTLTADGRRQLAPVEVPAVTRWPTRVPGL